MRTSTSPRIAFDDVGEREPALLFMPGWCGPRDVFRPLYAHLDRRALAVDWRDHGGSEQTASDFGTAQLVDDALAVITASGIGRFIPVGLAHAGWIAIELRKRLGPDRIPGVALIDWMVLGAPPSFGEALAALQRPSSWSEAASVRARAELDQRPRVRSVVVQMKMHWCASGNLPCGQPLRRSDSPHRDPIVLPTRNRLAYARS